MPAAVTEGVNPLRSLAAGIWVFLLIADLASHYNAGLPWIDHIEVIVRYAALLLMLWRPIPGALLGFVSLGISLVWLTSGSNVYVLAEGAILIGATAPVQFAGYFAAGQVLWVVAYVSRMSSERGIGLAIFVTTLAVGWLVGLTVRYFLGRQAAAAEQLAQLEARVRHDERAQLARELHDTVSHQLSIISVQAMGYRDSEAPTELRAALDRVRGSADSALAEMRMLVGLLRLDDAPIGARLPGPAELASAIEEMMAEGQFDIKIEVPASVELLDQTTQQTLTRLIREASTNILRHARPDAPSRIWIEVSPLQVRFVTTNVPADQDTPGGGQGITGLRERLALIGGELEAGLAGGSWRLEARFPVLTPDG